MIACYSASRDSKGTSKLAPSWLSKNNRRRRPSRSHWTCLSGMEYFVCQLYKTLLLAHRISNALVKMILFQYRLCSLSEMVNHVQISRQMAIVFFYFGEMHIFNVMIFVVFTFNAKSCRTLLDKSVFNERQISLWIGLPSILQVILHWFKVTCLVSLCMWFNVSKSTCISNFAGLVGSDTGIEHAVSQWIKNNSLLAPHVGNYSDGGWAPKPRSQSPTSDGKRAQIMFVCMFFSRISHDLEHLTNPKWCHVVAPWIVHCIGKGMISSECGSYWARIWKSKKDCFLEGAFKKIHVNFSSSIRQA